MKCQPKPYEIDKLILSYRCSERIEIHLMFVCLNLIYCLLFFRHPIHSTGPAMTLYPAGIPFVHPCSQLRTTTVNTLINVTMKLIMQISTRPLACFSMMSTFSTSPMESNLKFGWHSGLFTLQVQALLHHLSAIFTLFVYEWFLDVLSFLQACF